MLKAWCRAKKREINLKKSTGCRNELSIFIVESDSMRSLRVY